MANKEIAMSKLKKLMRILSEGGSLNDVVKACKMSKRDASYYKKYLQTMPLPLSEMYKMDEFSLGKLIRPESPSVPKPDGRKEVLDKEIKEYALDCLRPHKTLYYEWEKYYKLHPTSISRIMTTSTATITIRARWLCLILQETNCISSPVLSWMVYPLRCCAQLCPILILAI